jgi:hypothetical protein
LLLTGVLSLTAVVYLVYARGHQLDLAVFLRAGEAVRHGRSPYSALNSAELQHNAAFVYPLAVAWVFAPVAALGRLAPLVWAALSLAAIVLGCRIARAENIPGALHTVLPLVLLSSPAIIGLQDGSLNALLFLGLVLAWKYRDQNWMVAGVVTVLVVAKLFLWPLLGWLLLTRRYRAAAVSAALTGAVLGIGWAAGPLGLGGYTGMLDILSRIEAPHAAGLTGLLVSYRVPLGPATVVATGTGLALLAWAGWQLRSGRMAEQVLFSAAVVAALLASPIEWQHYYLLLAAALLVAGRSTWPLAVIALIGWAAAMPHAVTVAGFAVGLGGLGAVSGLLAWTAARRWRRALLPQIHDWLHPPRIAGLLASAVALGLVLASGAGRDAWGATVVVVESLGVVAFSWWAWRRRSKELLPAT